MSWFEGTRARLRLLFARRAAEARVNEELRFHIEMETERLMRDGLDADEARRRALVAFGGVTQHKEELRADRGFAWFPALSLDFRLGVRMLAKYPGLTAVSVIGMAIAVAIGAVSFSGISALIGSSLPLDEGDRIVLIQNVDTRTNDNGRRTHLHDLATWRDGLTTVVGLAAFRTVDRNLITYGGPPEAFRIAEMTASGFRLARVAPIEGRYFNDEDEQPGAAPVVVIGYDVWQNRFGGRRDIVGRAVDLGDARFTIIGVMPKGFAFPINNGVWTPLRLQPSAFDRGQAPSIDIIGRLADGASIDDARRELVAIGQRLSSAYPESHEHVRPRIAAYSRSFLGSPDAELALQLVQVLVSLLLVVIGTNVAILVYARTAARTGEIAIRTALGASRSRVVGQLFAEALVLSSLAAAMGLVIARFALAHVDALIVRMGGDQLPYWLHFGITPGVIAYAAGMAVLAAVIVGVLPALKATHRGVQSNLQQFGPGVGSMRLGRLWTFLIVAQVTVAVGVLPVAMNGIIYSVEFGLSKLSPVTKQVLLGTLFLDEPDAPEQSVPLGERSSERLRDSEPLSPMTANASARSRLAIRRCARS